MKRREFITLLGGAAAAWPLAAHAQQPAMPVIGFLNSNLNSTSLETGSHLLRAFRQGLKDTGYVEGENVAIEYRWEVGDDPVRLGLVASLARPGGNATGTNFFIYELGAKRLSLLRELVPTAARVAVLVNPATATLTEAMLRDMEAVGRAISLQLQIVNASTSHDIDAAFAAIASEHVDALFVIPDSYFFTRRVQLVQLAARHAPRGNADLPGCCAGLNHCAVGGGVGAGTLVPSR